jgi:predicted Zn finger-like uncharacterized protein
MILTCPECASRYFVDDARIGPEGRKVRCASCGHAWREVPPPPGSSGEAESASSAAAASLPLGEPIKLRGARSDVSSRLRDEAAEKRKTREAAAVGAVWAVLGAGFCILALGAAIFRTDVVRILPATAGAYAFIRMPVNPTGLAIEAVRGGPGLLNGHAALTVSGVERNVETHPRDAAPLRISLLDKGGHKLTGQVASPPASGPIQPGETRPFTLSFLDPPLQAASFQVEFAFDAMKPSARPVQRRAPPSPSPKPPALPAAALKLRGAAQPPSVPALQAKDAAPLPASSPYALPASAASPHG